MGIDNLRPASIVLLINQHKNENVDETRKPSILSRLPATNLHVDPVPTEGLADAVSIEFNNLNSIKKRSYHKWKYTPECRQ